MKEKKKFSFTPEKLWGIAIFVFFAWFIFAFLVFPNLNTVVSVFYQNGHFTTEVFTKLVHSAKAMRSLRNSLILAPTLSITVGFIGISLVLITEYFDIKGANILRLGYMTTLIYGGIILVSGYKFIYGKTGILTTLFAKIIPSFPIDWFEGYWAVLFVMTFACTSNHMIFLRNAMRSVDFQTVEAAQNMGASQFRILTKVVLPVLTPSLMAVTILTFITGLSATSAPLLVGGQGFQTITPMILTFANNVSSRPLAALLALFLGVATIILLTIMIQIEKRGHYMSVSKVKTTIVKQKIRNPILNVLAHVYAYLLFLIYVIPVALVVLFSFTDSATIASKHLTLSSFTLRKVLTYDNINIVGVEAIAKTADSEMIDPENLKWIREQGLYIWVNSINLGRGHELSGTYNDDVALSEGPDAAWGVLMDRGYNVIQTDWPSLLASYRDEKFGV